MSAFTVLASHHTARGIQLTRRPGRFVACLLLLALSLVSTVQAEQITLNLNNADIEALIKTVSEHTGKNFIIDPRVKGKVTVISAHPMEREEFYQVFLSILEVHGFSTIPSGDVIKIIPDVKAKQSGIPTTSARDSNFPGDQVVTRIIQVKNVTATQLVPILRPLIPQEGHLAAYPNTNVLIISDRHQNVERLLKIIEQIDKVSDSTIDVATLQHASAAEVVRIINGLQDQPNKGGGSPSSVKLVADERTNSILISGDPTGRLRAKVLIQHLDTPFDDSSNAQVIYLKYANAKEVVSVLTGVSESMDKSKKSGAAAGKPDIPINIQADEASNALIISAPPDQYRSLEAIIRKLDIRRAQVLVEAIIAEITYTKSKQLGVQWIVDGSGNNGSGPVGIINLGSPSISSIYGAIAGGKPPELGQGTTIGYGRFDSSGINFAAIIQALQADGSSNILSTPSLMTLDNQEAEIVVGQNVPFVTGSYQQGDQINPFQTIERKDVGLTLKVKPQINEGNAIKLEIDQGISSLDTTTITGAADVITKKRNVKTVVMVEDGDTVVLGGLIDDQLGQTEEKVPLLGDIPLLGSLFRSTSTKKEKRNLMIFIRPVIVRDAATSNSIAGSKYNYFRAQQLDIKQKGVKLMSDDETPVMPARFKTLPPPFDDLSLTTEQ